jgi:ABC-2 type transport system ATP-binding protein
VLILDEPANGLDPQARIDMRVLLLQLAEMGKTLIVTSHILPELARVCDLIGIITRGKLRAFGTVDEIMREIRQKRMFEIQLVNVEQVDRVADLVAKRLSVSPGDVVRAPAEMMVRFATSLSDLELSPLLTHLVEQGEAIAQFRELTTDLEDAFLSVTKQDDEDAGSKADRPEKADSDAGSEEQAASS